MPIDFEEQPGYNGATGPPQSFEDPNLRKWTSNKFHNARFGGELRADGLTQLLSIHPVRAMPLIGDTVNVPGVLFTHDSGNLPYVNHEVEDVLQDVPESAQDPVTITCRTNANMAGGREGILFLNDVPIFDDLWRSSPASPTGWHEDIRHVEIHGPSVYWNMLLAGGTEMRMRINSGTGEVSPGDVAKIHVAYQGKDQRHQAFANKEVCFPHRSVGFLMRGDGLAEPFVVYQPFNLGGRDGDVLGSIGQGWIVGDDEPADVGHPGMTVLGLPFESPHMIECIFSAYPSTCAVPV